MSVTFATAQNNNPVVKTELEDLSKQTFLDLMLLRKTKKIIC